MPSFPLSLSQWRYRKAFQITEQAGQNLTDYQRIIKIGESSGATGCDFHLEGLSAIFPSGKNQGGDLRFHDGQNELSFWVEQVIGTSPNRIAYVWVKIPSLNANQTKTLYIYFGNQLASNVSNGNNTFDFFDDFEGTSIDTTKWDTSGVTILSYSNSMVNYKSNTSNHRYLMYKLATYSNVSIRARQKDGPGTDYPVIGLVTRKSTYSGNTIDNLYYSRFYATSSSSGNSNICKRVTGTEYAIQLDNSVYPTSGTWYVEEFSVYGNSLKHKLLYDSNYTSVGAGEWNATDTSHTSGYVGLFSEWNTKNIYTDWILVRKYTSPEPAFSSAGSLERRSSIIPLII
jgi:hypothetical protein